MFIYLCWVYIYTHMWVYKYVYICVYKLIGWLCVVYNSHVCKQMFSA